MTCKRGGILPLPPLPQPQPHCTLHIDTTDLPLTSFRPNLSEFNPTHLTLTQKNDLDTKSDLDTDIEIGPDTDYDLEKNSFKYTSFEKECLNLELICSVFSPIFAF